MMYGSDEIEKVFPTFSARLRCTSQLPINWLRDVNWTLSRLFSGDDPGG